MLAFLGNATHNKVQSSFQLIFVADERACYEWQLRALNQCRRTHTPSSVAHTGMFAKVFAASHTVTRVASEPATFARKLWVLSTIVAFSPCRICQAHWNMDQQWQIDTRAERELCSGNHTEPIRMPVCVDMESLYHDGNFIIGKTFSISTAWSRLTRA